MGETRDRESGLIRAALDDICRIAARITKSDIVCIVSAIDETHATICGAVGTNVVILDGTVVIPSLDRRPLIVCADLKKTSWFQDHALASLAPFAASLIVVMIQDEPSQPPYYLALFNPRPSYQKDTSILASLSELSRIARSLISRGYTDAHELSLESSERIPPDTLFDLDERSRSIIPNLPNLTLLDGGSLAGTRNIDPQSLETAGDPLLYFLNRSLIKRRLLKSRKSVVFVTLRTWRKTTKDTQIDALRSLKLERSPRAIHSIASEMALAIQELYSGILFTAVIPIPGGNSGHENSFSVLLAAEIARILSIPFSSVLVGRVKKGSSHPKESASLPPYKVQGSVTGQVLLVDDVASSGAHMEKAIIALKHAGAFPMAMAWIGS